MNGKKLIFLVEGIMILLFIAALSFFYQARLTSKILKVYQNQSKKAAEAVNGLTSLVGVFKQNNEILTAKLAGFDQEKKDLADQNVVLKEKTSSLEAQSKSLEAQVNELKESNAKIQEGARSNRASLSSEDTLVPVEAKLKNISVMVDSIDLSASDKKKIQTLLSSIYKELSLVDLNIAKIAGQEPLYRDKFAAKEKEMTAYYEKIKKLSQDNIVLTEQIKQAKGQLSSSQDKMRFLEEQQKQYQAQKDTLAQNISQYNSMKGVSNTELDKLRARLAVMQEANKKFSVASKQKNQMESDLRRLTAELKDKEDKTKGLESQSADMSLKYQDAQSKYDSTVKEMDKLRSDIGARSDKVLSLQESLDAKNSSLTELSVKVQDQIKEMALLREKVVKSQIENAKLSNSLKATDQAFNLLKEEMNNIGQINVKVKEYLDQASSNLNTAVEGNVSSAAVPVLTNKVEEPVALPLSSGSKIQPQATVAENKEVMVNISSVEPQNVTGQENPAPPEPIAPPDPAPAVNQPLDEPVKNN